MKNYLLIEKIIHSFRGILGEIFDLQQNDTYIKEFFKTGNEIGINKRINTFFDEEIKKTPCDAKDLNVMRDAILYLIERIKKAPHEVKVLLYINLFHKEEIFTEEEVQHIMDNFGFFN